MAADIGFNRPTFSQTTNSVEPYESYVERAQMALAPEFTVETLSSVALWTDGSTKNSFRDWKVLICGT